MLIQFLALDAGCILSVIILTFPTSPLFSSTLALTNPNFFEVVFLMR